jgi:hypothetical protein
VGAPVGAIHLHAGGDIDRTIKLLKDA